MSALLRKYSDLTDDGRRIYDAISRRIEKIDRTRRALLSITRSLKTRTPEERERAGARNVVLAHAKRKLMDFRSDMLGRIRPWHETGVIDVRAGVLSASFRLADVDGYYLSGLGLSTKWALIEGRGPVDLDALPADATALAVAIVGMNDVAAREVVEGERRADVRPKTDPVAHWKDHDPSPEHATS